MTITSVQLYKSMPKCPMSRADEMLGPMNDAMDRAKIDNRLRMAAFIASVGHESLDLTFMQEIASGERYEGRLDLGNDKVGDGKRFKGRGPIQITGRANYTLFARWSGLDCVKNPALLEIPANGFLASAWFWQHKGLNDPADQGDFLRVSIRINGRRKDGFPNGWPDRQARYALALKVLP